MATKHRPAIATQRRRQAKRVPGAEDGVKDLPSVEHPTDEEAAAAADRAAKRWAPLLERLAE